MKRHHLLVTLISCLPASQAMLFRFASLRRFACLFAAAAFLPPASCLLQAEPTPFPTVTVFEGGKDGYNIFRIPAVIQAANTDLLVFCEARVGGDASEIDLVMKRSEDGGKSWGPLQVVKESGRLQKTLPHRNGDHRRQSRPRRRSSRPRPPRPHLAPLHRRERPRLHNPQRRPRRHLVAPPRNHRRRKKENLGLVRHRSRPFHPTPKRQTPRPPRRSHRPPARQQQQRTQRLGGAYRLQRRPRRHLEDGRHRHHLRRRPQRQ